MEERKKLHEAQMEDDQQELIIKPLKKKVAPKKVVADAQGDWEVVD